MEKPNQDNQQSDSVTYQLGDKGNHIVTLDFCDRTFAFIRTVAYSFGKSESEKWVLDAIHEEIVSGLGEISNKHARTMVKTGEAIVEYEDHDAEHEGPDAVSGLN